MKRPSTTKTLLAGAALAGILSGGLVAKATAATTAQPGKTGGLAGVLADAAKPDPDHGCAGKNTCKGKGGCKSGDNGCGGKNSCKGKGGCAIKDGKPVHPVK